MTFYKLVRYLLILFFKIPFRLKVAGSQNIPRKGGFILASNHLSYVDPLVVGLASFRELDFMAKEELFRNFFFGMLIRALNAFPLKRRAHDAGAMAVAIDRIRRGRVLLMFPEGTRSITGEFGPPHRGVSYLADATDAPVVPCYIQGSNEALPIGSKKMRVARLGVYFGAPLKYKGEGYKDFADSIMREVAKLKEQSDAG